MRVLNQEKGMVLLLVLVVVALLTALLSEFAFSTLVDLRLTETFRDRTRAYYLARGGITVGRMFLKDDRNSYDAYAPEELWSHGLGNYPVGEGFVSVDIEDLGGKLNINSLVRGGSNVDPLHRKRFNRFFADLGEADPEELTAALIDWIDRDSAPYADPDSGAVLGAEDDYYQRQPVPSRCGNRPLSSLEELAMVRGFTPELIRRIEPHVTVYGSEEVKINVNTASAEVLMAFSEDPVIGREAAEQIVERRRDKPFKTAGELIELNRIPGLENLVRTGLAVDSGFFRIRSAAEVNDGARRMEAIIKKADVKLLYQKVD